MINPKSKEPRRGRPPTGVTKKRYFRMDDDSYAIVVKASEIKGETISEFIRRVVLASANRTVSANKKQ